MNLIEVAYYEDCTRMDKRSVPDGYGGFINRWEQGAKFRAAIVKDVSTEGKIAEKQGVTELYTITFPKGAALEYHDVIKRTKDGSTFRVTSNAHDSETPSVASFKIGQVSAERWELV